MGYLLAAKELLKYRYPSLVNVILRVKQLINRNQSKSACEIQPYWSIFLTYSCTADCFYCVQNYSFKTGRKDSPLKGKLSPENWLLLNNAPNRPTNIVITGGEPFLYNGLEKLVAGLSGFKEVWIVTNLTLDISDVIENLKKVKHHRIIFHCSYHVAAIDFETFLARVILIKKAGFLGSVRIVDVEYAKTKQYIKKFATHGIKIQSLFRVGMKDQEVLVTSNPEASNLYRKPPVLCRTKLALFAPNGDVYNCHTKLYWNDYASSFGNIITGFNIPDDYCVCHDY